MQRRLWDKTLTFGISLFPICFVYILLLPFSSFLNAASHVPSTCATHPARGSTEKAFITFSGVNNYFIYLMLAPVMRNNSSLPAFVLLKSPSFCSCYLMLNKTRFLNGRGAMSRKGVQAESKHVNAERGSGREVVRAESGCRGVGRAGSSG